MAIINGTPKNDILKGTNKNDILNINSSKGDDQMSGLKGNDIYIVNSAGDTVTEKANEGTDTVKSSVTFTLGDNVENLTLTGFGPYQHGKGVYLNGTGNALNNILIGNDADNKLFGNEGSDTLYGGKGHNTLQGGGGIGQDTYHLTGGKENPDTLVINQGDSSFQLSNHTPINFDRVIGLDKYDKIDLPDTAIMGNSTVVNAPFATDHFKGYSIKDGVILLTDGHHTKASLSINTLALVKEAYTFLAKNCLPIHLHQSAILPVNYQGQHDILFHAHTPTNITTVDILGHHPGITHQII